MSQQSSSTEQLRYPYARKEKENRDYLKISIIRYKESNVGSALFGAGAGGNIFNFHQHPIDIVLIELMDLLRARN